MNVHWIAHLGHPYGRRLALFAAGVLPPGEQDDLEAHLRGCPACRQRLACLVRVSEGLRSAARTVSDLPPSPALRAKWQRHILSAKPHTARRATEKERPPSAEMPDHGWASLLIGRRPALLGLALTWLGIALLHLTAPQTPEAASLPLAASARIAREILLADRQAPKADRPASSPRSKLEDRVSPPPRPRSDGGSHECRG